MKIVAIRGKNLASLEGDFEIDFMAEPLKSAGIFAITGSTGSGKSTLLDALCLALFEDTPRNNRASENISIVDVKDKTINQKDSRNILRRGTSDGYAEVDFVSLGGETFRSRWSVDRAYGKIDGSLQSAKFKLTNLTTNNEVQGQKTELKAEVVKLIGLTFDQFTRAVLLAQGDFATFLKAKQSEKAELLEKLTGTDIYSRISSTIYNKSTNAEHDLALLQERIKDIELLSDEARESLSAEKQALLLEVELLKMEISQLTTKIKWLADEAMLAHGVKQAQQQLIDAEQVIEQAKPRYEYIAQTDSVQAIRDNYNELIQSQKQLESNRTNLTKQELERDANALLLNQATTQLTACQEEQTQQSEKIAQIAPQIKRARELDVRIVGAKANAQEAKKEYEQSAESKIKIEKSIDTTQAAITSAEQTVWSINRWFEENKQYIEVVPRVDLIVNLLEDTATANTQGSSNAKTLTESKKIADVDAAKLTQLKTEEERLNRLLPTEIAELRAKLQEGVPCAVCGSLHHPKSNEQGESLEQEEINRAKKVVGDKLVVLTQRIEERKNENIRLQSIIDSYATQSKEAVAKLETYLKTLPLWQQQFEQGKLQHTIQEIAKQWHNYTSQRTVTTEQIVRFKTSLEHEKESLSTLNTLLISKEEKRKNSSAELAKLLTERSTLLDGRLADEVEKQYTDKSKEIDDRLKKLTASKGEIAAKSETFVGVITQISVNIATLSIRCNSLQTAVDSWLTAQNGTITADRLAQLLARDSSWLATEREALNRLRENKTTVQATLAERSKTLKEHHEAQVKPTQGEEHEMLQITLSEKTRQVVQKTTRNTEIELSLANHEKGKAKIKMFEKELNEKSVLSENWKKLNEMFGSATGAKFKVLAQGYTLEALLTYANKHLHELSKRYELQRIPETLALQVVDLDMLGEVRTVHSLSGGESFLISLALALGLSSLSSNRMKVESLFIDEGFGSLDIDTLRVAMDALERLQTQGRKIGVISHVAEMTERITAQVRVVKASNGSSRIE